MSGLQMGMVGLGVMGRNLALNLADKGFSVGGWDAWPEPVTKLVTAASDDKTPNRADVRGFTDLKEFVQALAKPRRIIMLVKAGEVVDQTIAKLVPLLDKGDLLIDGGNEYFLNTERRSKELEAKGFKFFGMGVSGGEEGARNGPSMMPGGDREAYEHLAPVLTKIAAQADGSCVTYIGPGGAGHYVKMVHNGIEYGDMQLIAEAYDVLRTVGGLSNAELADVFSEWNRGDLQSFLIEITAEILRKKDPEDPSSDLLDKIVDAASMKGTGKWTVQQAAEVGAPVPTIASAVDARVLSGNRALRKLTGALPGPKPSVQKDPQLVADVRAALYAAKACAYAQGMALLQTASQTYKWNLNLSELARIWTGGCIIRAQFLGRIKASYLRDPELGNLLLDEDFQRELGERQTAFRRVVAKAAQVGLPLPAHFTALSYYDTLRRERLPTNLTQAQRDYFGAHTYERIDKPGNFHTEWSRD
ncbi:MAG TPA: NADP-dependent phosphogluconate dehydrogenase [Polyangiales bacterium]|nr:NADP-dependent phosphogluconate dehydrogenase [Polyangiales bacterium]